MHGKEHHIMWEREWLEGKITIEEAKKRAGNGNNIIALLQSTEQVSQFDVKTHISKEMAWEKLEEKIAAGTKSKVIIMPRRYWITGVAASFILAIGALFLFQQSLTDTNQQSVINTQVAQSQDITLPDGSTVALNAESNITYSEETWSTERIVELDGEGFFEVVKGNRFVVTTAYGEVEVLGTSFNVSTRNGRLEVSCKTGKVRVTELTRKSSQTITPGQKVTAVSGVVKTPVLIDTDQVGSWQDGDFDFESRTLTEVLEEFQRQFDVSLEYDSNDPEIKDRIYNGYFSNDNMIEAIQLICSPMGLNYTIEDKTISILSNQVP